MTLKSLWPVTQQFQNKNGSNLVSGKIYIYYQGRTALATTYHDEEGTVVNANPVLLDNNGRATVFADTAYSYTIVVCDYYGKELFSQDITLHDVTETADEITLIGSDGSIHIDTSSSNGVKTFDMSANTDILATKKSVDDLDIRVKKNEDDIKVISGNVENIATEMYGKKDKQTELTFNGSATKTIKNITQNTNGEINVEYADIDLPQEVPNVEITSEDNSVQITETTDTQTNTKKFDLSVNVDDKIPDPSTSNPLMDGTASVGSSSKYAREDHVHPSDTSKEAVSNKTSVVLGTSNSKYPTDKAVADFVNSSIATNTANYISNNGEPFTSVEELEAYTGTVTNNDYAFVTGTDDAGNTYYDRYKATVSGSTVTWALEYRLNNSSFTAAQWAAINSGVTSDKANYWDGKQDALTAGDNVTINENTISSNQVFVATYGTTKYAEVKAAYDAGKICTVFKDTRYYYISEINTERIKFVVPTPDPNIFSLTLTKADQWSAYNPWLQTHLTFDSAPRDGSKNPVTSDGIKTAIEDSVDQTYSSTSNKAQSGVAVNEAFKTRETSSSDDSYTYIGMSKTYKGKEELYWKLVSFKTVDTHWTLQFEVDVSNGKKSDGSYDTELYETKRLTICGSKPGDVLYARVLRFTAQGVDVNRGYVNNIYYEIGSSNLVTVYIKAIDTPNKTQLCRLTDVINFKGISNITWYEPVADAGTQPTNPVKFKEVFPAIASTSSNLGSDSVPVYVNKGKPVACNSSNLKAGKDDNGNVIKNTYATKAALDSRVPAPTSTTGTQVLKCINGVIQWVNE